MEEKERCLDVFRNDWFTDSWVWDSENQSPDVMLSQDKLAAYFHVDPVCGSTGTAGIRGTKAFLQGEHYWEMTFTEPPSGTSVMIGVGTRDACLQTEEYDYIDLLGRDSQSWGLSYKGTIWHRGQKKKYCEPIYDQYTVIGCHLDLNNGTIAFFKDGKCLGMAFKGLDNVGKPLYPMISSTTAETELEVGIRTCRYMSLQDKCCYTVIKSLKCADDTLRLPLPSLIIDHLNELR